MKLVIYPDVDIWNYVLSGLRERCDVLLFPLNQSCNIFQKVLRKSTMARFLPSQSIIGAPLLQALNNLTAGDVILLCEYTDLSLVAALSKATTSSVSKHLWLWNSKGYSPSFSGKIKFIKSQGFRVTTYNEDDSKSYSIDWHTQFFSINYVQNISFTPNKYKYDFFFVGYKKNREIDIAQVQSSLANYHCCFRIAATTSDYIPYAYYMEMASQSRCIVDIVHRGDTACTLRPLEAMALRRKLLTNNPRIRHYSFYNPQNIFIFGEDNLSDLPVFLNTPFNSIHDVFVNNYDINSWIDSFL